MEELDELNPETCEESDLRLRFRCEVGTDMNFALESNAALVWEEYKRLFYHFKYNRDFYQANEAFLGRDELQYYF